MQTTARQISYIFVETTQNLNPHIKRLMLKPQDLIAKARPIRQKIASKQLEALGIFGQKGAQHLDQGWFVGMNSAGDTHKQFAWRNTHPRRPFAANQQLLKRLLPCAPHKITLWLTWKNLSKLTWRLGKLANWLPMHGHLHPVPSGE